MKGQASFLKQNIWYIIVFIVGVGAFSAMIFNLFTLEGDIARVATEITNQRLINNIELNEVDGAAAALVSVDNSIDNLSVQGSGRVLSMEAENNEDASGYIATMSDVNFPDQTDVGESVCFIAEAETITVDPTANAQTCQPTSCSDGNSQDMGSYGLYCQGGVWTREGYHEHVGSSDVADGNAEIAQFNCPDAAYAFSSTVGCGVQFYHHCEKGSDIEVRIQNQDGPADVTPTNSKPITCTGNRTVAEAAASFTVTISDSVTLDTQTIEVEISGPFGTITETTDVDVKALDRNSAAGIILQNIPGL